MLNAMGRAADIMGAYWNTEKMISGLKPKTSERAKPGISKRNGANSSPAQSPRSSVRFVPAIFACSSLMIVMFFVHQ